MDNKLYKLLVKIQNQLMEVFNNMVNGDGELLKKVVAKNENGEFIEDKNHWDKMLVEIGYLYKLIYKLENRALTITDNSGIQIIKNFLETDYFLFDYDNLSKTEEKHLKSQDARTRCLEKSLHAYRYIWEIIELTEERLGIDSEPSNKPLQQLNTELTDDQRGLLFELLVQDGFIPGDTNKDGFIWALGGENDEYTSFKITWLVDAVFLIDLLREIKKSEIILEEMKVRAKSFFINKKEGIVRIDSYKKKKDHPNYKKLMKIINTVQSHLP